MIGLSNACRPSARLHTGWRVSELLPMRWGDLHPSHTAPGAMRYTWSSRAGTTTTDILPADCFQAILHFLTLGNRTRASMQPTDFI